MKSKSTAFKSGLILLLFSFTWVLSNAQSVSVSGPTSVNIGCENQYTAAVSNVPSTWTIVDYKWEARYIGVHGKMKYVSGYDGQGNPVYTRAGL